MNYKDIEKFARENNELARDIADYECRCISCSECVFFERNREPYQCLSLAMKIVLNEHKE